MTKEQKKTIEYKTAKASTSLNKVVHLGNKFMHIKTI